MPISLPSPALSRLTLIVGRLAIAALFLHEAWFKATHYDLAGAYMARFGLPQELLPAALALELVGGLALATGLLQRWAALGLAAFCVAAALIFHLNWADQNQLLHFQKDIAIAGGLLVLALRESDDGRG